MQLLNEIRFNNLRGDLFGGVTAAVVALPMALAFGVASGAGPAAGLYGAVLVGLFAALFGGTPTLISEPTGPMTVVMTAVIANLVAANPENGMAMAFTVVMLAGVFQILFGALKLGHYVTMMPYTVISGFMTGIGVILIILQLGPFLGHATPPGGVLGTLERLPTLIADIRWPEAALAVFTFGLIVLFPARLQRTLPPQLIALVFGSLVSVFVFAELDIRRIGEIPTGLPELQLPVFSAAQWQLMVDQLARIDEICAERGLRQVFHPHVDSLVETEGEIERVLEASDVAFVLETGHMMIGGFDPLEFATSHPERIGLVHLKDVTVDLIAPLNNDELTLMEAVQAGLFPSLGADGAPLAGAIAALESTGYDGWYIIEQDAAITDGFPSDGDGPIRDVLESVAYLRSIEPSIGSDLHTHNKGEIPV